MGYLYKPTKPKLTALINHRRIYGQNSQLRKHIGSVVKSNLYYLLHIVLSVLYV